ncbi:hypothetical protein [Ornithinibacillus xuwenensis]|uniref:Uncharacterized protein n=1 Tax=Ornithinibacillus xuwenensis TaxID=3144668 RepID=A0ABU9XCW4_9BACI
MKTKVFLLSLLVSYITIFLFPVVIEGDILLGYPINFITLFDINEWYKSPLSVVNPFNIVNISLNVLSFVLNAMIYFFIILLGVKMYKKTKPYI